MVEVVWFWLKGGLGTAIILEKFQD